MYVIVCCSVNQKIFPFNFFNVIYWRIIVVSISIIFFAFSTIIGWSYYGDRCVDYLFGQKWVTHYKIIYCIIIPVGATIELSTVWTISDIFNALMAWPNLLGIILLSPFVVRKTKEYFSDPDKVYPPYAKK